MESEVLINMNEYYIASRVVLSGRPLTPIIDVRSRRRRVHPELWFAFSCVHAGPAGVCVSGVAGFRTITSSSEEPVSFGNTVRLAIPIRIHGLVFTEPLARDTVDPASKGAQRGRTEGCD